MYTHVARYKTFTASHEYPTREQAIMAMKKGQMGDKKFNNKGIHSIKKSGASNVVKSEKFLERNIIGSGFRTPRKGLINSNSIDDLARF